MKDWKKKFDRLMNPGKAIMEGDVGVYAFWEAIGNYGEWNRPKVLEVIRPILESLFSEQEAEHKKQMREVIKEVGKELEDSEGNSAHKSVMVMGMIDESEKQIARIRDAYKRWTFAQRELSFRAGRLRKEWERHLDYVGVDKETYEPIMPKAVAKIRRTKPHKLSEQEAEIKQSIAEEPDGVQPHGGLLRVREIDGELFVRVSDLELQLKRQEAEHKKQMREAIEEAYFEGEIKGACDAGVHVDSIDVNLPLTVADLFKIYNCEEGEK